MADTGPYWDFAGHGDLEPGGPMPPPATDEDIAAWDAANPNPEPAREVPASMRGRVDFDIEPDDRPLCEWTHSPRCPVHFPAERGPA